MKKPTKYFMILLLWTTLFCLAIGFDVSPYLRGPAPYPPEWQWPYLFVNTLSRIFAPLLCMGLLIGLFFWEEKKHVFTKRTPLLLFLVILLSFCLQLSLLFFSRSGISVLIHRIIDPTLNGYFTASLTIHSVVDFLKNYNHNFLHYVYHAKAHPPGAILFFYALKQLITPFTFFINYAGHINPTHEDVRQTWNMLLPLDKATALFASLFIPFLSTISLIPLYCSAKMLFGDRVAIRSIFLFFLIPTIVFFIPINDAFLHLFSLTSFFFFVKGLQKNSMVSLLLSGITLFVGVTYNLSLLPILLLLLVFATLFLRQQKTVAFSIYIKDGLFFSLGFFLPPVLLALFFHYNFFATIQTIMKYVPDVHTRSYLLWLPYNIYDFFVFSGLPITIVFMTILWQTLMKRQNKQVTNLGPVFIALLTMLVILDISGSVRAETGRLWSPYTPFMVLVATQFLTNQLKFSTKLFIGFLLLQALQVLVMQEFWVMLW